jgi:hypothetical protein
MLHKAAIALSAVMSIGLPSPTMALARGGGGGGHGGGMGGGGGFHDGGGFGGGGGFYGVANSEAAASIVEVSAADSMVAI